MSLFSAKIRDSMHPVGVSRLALMLLIKVMIASSGATVIPKCPSDGSPSTATDQHCICMTGSTLSGASVTIICDFGNKEDVVLTEDLYPFGQWRLVQAYVRIENATSLAVTEGFLGIVQSSPAVVLDIWSSGQLTFDSSPEVTNYFPSSYTTFIGIGIINCSVPSIPENLLRDREIGRLLIRGCKVGVISQNTLLNIGQMKNLIIEDSSVDRVAGPLSNSGPISLMLDSERSLEGFRIYNSSIGSIAPSSLQFVVQDSNPDYNPSEVKLVNSRLGDLGSEAISVVGKLHLTIQGNTFQRLSKHAIKVNVTGDLKFEENVIEFLEPGGLKSLICGNRTSMQKNTIHMESLHESPFNTSTIPFEASCGNPQVFIVMSPSQQPKTLLMTSNATWILLSVLIVFLIGISFVGIQMWRSKSFLREYRRGQAPLAMPFGETTTMNELRNSDDNDDDDDEEEAERDTGMSNPVYDIKEPN